MISAQAATCFARQISIRIDITVPKRTIYQASSQLLCYGAQIYVVPRTCVIILMSQARQFVNLPRFPLFATTFATNIGFLDMPLLITTGNNRRSYRNQLASSNILLHSHTERFGFERRLRRQTPMLHYILPEAWAQPVTGIQ